MIKKCIVAVLAVILSCSVFASAIAAETAYDSRDLACLIQILLEVSEPSERYDFNSDGLYNVQDLIILKKKLASTPGSYQTPFIPK